MDLSTFDFTSMYLRKYVQGSVYTAMPAAITSVASFQTEQVISVQPLIKNESEDGVILDLPTVLDVPVMFPSGGGGIITFPLQVGDQVLLIFSMKSISEYVNATDNHATPYVPDTGRNHDLSDAIAIPCLFGKSNNLAPDPDHVEVKFAGTSVKLKKDGDLTADVAKDLVVTVAGKADITVTGDTTITSPTINLIGDVNVTGNFASSGGSFTHEGTNVGTSHTHNGSATAPTGPVSNTGAPN